MTMKSALIAAAASLALTGCVAASDERPAPGEGQSAECNADNAQFAVGERYSEGLSFEAQQAAGANTVRKIEPDMAYTMEFRGDRLNLEVDRRDMVTTVRCG